MNTSLPQPADLPEVDFEEQEMNTVGSLIVGSLVVAWCLVIFLLRTDWWKLIRRG